MDNRFAEHSGVVISVVFAVVGLNVAGFGTVRGDAPLFWGGLFLAAVGVVLGKPSDPEEEIDRRAEEHE